ncbi:MAG: MaoC/PaaZ C-terminal domain-containing protein [Halioglobus sp.]
MSEPFYFEDHNVGESVNCGSLEVMAEDVIAFARQWDPQPWHIDEAAAKASVFGGLTACSAHIFSMYSISSPQWENGRAMQAIASLGFDEMRMLAPVYAGDTLRCVTTTDAARISKSRPDCGIVVYASQLINQNEQVVFSIKCSTLMARNPELLDS